MESIDNSFIGLTTHNGVIIKLIKNSLEKELTLQKDSIMQKKIKSTVSSIVLAWDNFILDATNQIKFIHLYKQKCDFGDIKQICITRAKYENSPIETLYLKILQHEFLGNIKDIIKVTDTPTAADYNVPRKLVDEMKQMNRRNIHINDVEGYINKNAGKIVKYIYWDTYTKEDVRRIKNQKKKLTKFLDFCIRANIFLDRAKIFNELQLISFLQAILLDNSKEIFDYIFYGYQYQGRKHRPHVQAALKNDNHTIDALQIYWTRKVVYRWYANLGEWSMLEAVKELEKTCDFALVNILSRPNLDEMLSMQEYYLEVIGNKINTTVFRIKKANDLGYYLNSKGFKYVDNDYMLAHIF